MIKYPGIDSYQIKRKKYPLRITQFTKSSGSFATMATILLQWQLSCYNKAGFKNADWNTVPRLMLSTCLSIIYCLQLFFFQDHIRETGSSNLSVWIYNGLFGEHFLKLWVPSEIQKHKLHFKIISENLKLLVENYNPKLWRKKEKKAIFDEERKHTKTYLHRQAIQPLTIMLLKQPISS